MWLLGAGASASAGIPTAENLIWQFKKALFCAAQRVSPKSCDDLSSVNVQRRLNDYFSSVGIFPREGTPEEYAAYFEAAYRDPGDRRMFLDGLLKGANPSYGHLALAALMKVGLARLIWTVNFDKLIEDAAVQIFEGTSGIVVATLDNPSATMEALNEERWPLIAKMHGDFQSQKLKNTPEELRSQDAEIRQALLESTRRYGLIVAGYSGRDESVLSTLQEAVEADQAFPGGLFWFWRSDSKPLPAVTKLIEKASSRGVRAEMLEVQTFDELLGDLLKQLGNIPPEIEAKLNRHAARISGVPLHPPGRDWPVIRLNALPVTTWPTICRRVVCQIGGTKDVREAIEKARAQVVAARTRAGVLAFGGDEEIRRVFSPFRITDFDCHSIETTRLRFESGELGLLRDSFARAIENAGPFRVRHSRHGDVLHADFSRAPAHLVAALQDRAGSLTGVVPNTQIPWSEVLRIKLDYQLGRLWLLIEPTVFFADSDNNNEERDIAIEFVRERTAVRYNRQWNRLMEAWIALIMAGRTALDVASFGIADGIDAHFTVDNTTAFSRRSTTV